MGSVFVAAALAGIATFLLVRGAGPPARPPTPAGGLLVLTDGSRARADADEVELAASVSDTGYSGADRLYVRLTFRNPRPGLRWTLVASGQYQIAPTTPANVFCVAGIGRAMADDVVCPGETYRGPPVVLRRHRELAVVGPGGRISDYNGYEPGASSTISGGLPGDENATSVVETAWPIRDVATVAGGSSTYGALAPLAANDNEYGALEKLSSRDILDRSAFADAKTFAPLNPAVVQAQRFEVEKDLGFQSIANASPPARSSDKLLWVDPDIRDAGIRYVLHDPIGEGGLLRKTFLGGVIGGLAAALLVWGVELTVSRWRPGAR